MIKILIFIILILLFILAFPISFTFFNTGFSNILVVLNNYGGNFINIFKNLFIGIFNAPTLVIFISVSVCLMIFRIIFKAFIRGDNDD